MKIRPFPGEVQNFGARVIWTQLSEDNSESSDILRDKTYNIDLLSVLIWT